MKRIHNTGNKPAVPLQDMTFTYTWRGMPLVNLS